MICKEKKRLTPQEALQHKWIRQFTKKDYDVSVIKKLNIQNMKKF